MSQSVPNAIQESMTRNKGKEQKQSQTYKQHICNHSNVGVSPELSRNAGVRPDLGQGRKSYDQHQQSENGANHVIHLRHQNLVGPYRPRSGT
jgi:hypothetical protein